MPWVEHIIKIGKNTKLFKRYFHCGWCGHNIMIDKEENQPTGWVRTEAPEKVEYFCCRRCRHEYRVEECQ